MPKPVREVPNQWRPYMDGQIWEFTEDEWSEMYPPFAPMRDQMGDYCGMQVMTWSRKGYMYIRFYHRDKVIESHAYDYPEYLAGWIGEQPTNPSAEWYKAHFPDKFDVG